jgi:hypothetical protein
VRCVPFHRLNFIQPSTLIKDMDLFQHFAYHCQYAYFNDTLKDYVHSLEIPWPESVVPLPKTFPPWDNDLNLDLHPILWHFLRVLSNEVGGTPASFVFCVSLILSRTVVPPDMSPNVAWQNGRPIFTLLLYVLMILLVACVSQISAESRPFEA